MRAKSLIALILCVIYSFSAKSQQDQLDYHPMVKEGKKWEIQIGTIKENFFWSQISGDTIIDGKEWKKVYNSRWTPGYRDSYYLAIREEGKKVYAIAKGSHRPRLLYDFGLKEGDRVKCGVESTGFGCLLDKDENPDTLLGFPFVNYLRVERIDTISTGGLIHRRIMLTLLDSYRNPFHNGESLELCNVVWIEGVGSGAGPFSVWMPLPPSNYMTLRCKEDGQSIFSDFYKEYNDNVETNIGSKYIMKEGNNKKYNLLGRRISKSNVHNTPYIQNGKKYLGK